VRSVRITAVRDATLAPGLLPHLPVMNPSGPFTVPGTNGWPVCCSSDGRFVATVAAGGTSIEVGCIAGVLCCFRGWAGWVVTCTMSLFLFSLLSPLYCMYSMWLTHMFIHVGAVCACANACL